MKKIFGRALSYILVVVATCCLTLVISGNWQRISPESKLTELMYLLDQYYADDLDVAALEDAAAGAMVDALPDRWSYYISAADYAAYLESKNNAYVGIGVTIMLAEQGYSVTKVAEGGPAEEAGIQAGDILIASDGTSLAGLDTSQGKELIQGKEGTTVEITVLRDGEEITYTVERRTVRTKVATATMLEGNIGLVTIANFNSHCAEESIAAVEQLLQQGATMLIFDVRNNGGGYTKEMVDLLDYLLPEGLLFRTVDYAGKENRDYSDRDCVDVPMAVLVNGNSYSAAEFFAAALKEYDAAILVGEQTSGKGFYQLTYTMSDGSAVAISSGRYYTPKGESLEGIGLTPEVYVEVDSEMANAIYAGILPPMEDDQILAAIAALKG